MDSVIEFARQDRVSEALNELLLTAAYQLIELAMGAELQDYLHAVGDSFAQIHIATDASRVW